MITTCPHCGRAVATDEPIVKTRLGWTPTACCNGDGPIMQGGEILLNHPFWYSSVINDRGEKALLMGPYDSYEEARQNAIVASRKAAEVDPKAPWYRYGTASGTAQRKTVFGKGEKE